MKSNSAFSIGFGEKSPSILNRDLSPPSNLPLSLTQNLADQAVSTFIEGAKDKNTLVAMTAGSLAYRFGRIWTLLAGSSLAEGSLLPTLVRGSSYLIGFAGESLTFAGVNRGFKILEGQKPTQSFIKDWAHAAVTLAPLKIFPALFRDQNFPLQHLLTDAGMVTGNHLAYKFHIGEKPEGDLAQQFFHAEAMNWQMKAGLGLVQMIAPGLSAFERGLDLSLISKEQEFNRKIKLFYSPYFAFEGGNFLDPPGLEKKNPEKKIEWYSKGKEKGKRIKLNETGTQEVPLFKLSEADKKWIEELYTKYPTFQQAVTGAKWGLESVRDLIIHIKLEREKFGKIGMEEFEIDHPPIPLEDSFKHLTQKDLRDMYEDFVGEKKKVIGEEEIKNLKKKLIEIGIYDEMGNLRERDEENEFYYPEAQMIEELTQTVIQLNKRPWTSAQKYKIVMQGYESHHTLPDVTSFSELPEILNLMDERGITPGDQYNLLELVIDSLESYPRGDRKAEAFGCLRILTGHPNIKFSALKEGLEKFKNIGLSQALKQISLATQMSPLKQGEKALRIVAELHKELFQISSTPRQILGILDLMPEDVISADIRQKMLYFQEAAELSEESLKNLDLYFSRFLPQLLMAKVSKEEFLEHLEFIWKIFGEDDGLQSFVITTRAYSQEIKKGGFPFSLGELNGKILKYLPQDLSVTPSDTEKIEFVPAKDTAGLQYFLKKYHKGEPISSNIGGPWVVHSVVEGKTHILRHEQSNKIRILDVEGITFHEGERLVLIPSVGGGAGKEPVPNTDPSSSGHSLPSGL